MTQTEYIDHIDHEGIVVGVNRASGKLSVRLTDAGDCAGCPAAKLCGVADKGNDSRIDLSVEHPEMFSLGERVKLRGTEKMHRKAIMVATVVPCIAMLAVMIAIYVMTGSQPAAALGGIGATIFFFALLWIMRDKVRHEFRFTVHKL